MTNDLSDMIELLAIVTRLARDKWAKSDPDVNLVLEEAERTVEALRERTLQLNG